MRPQRQILPESTFQRRSRCACSAILRAHARGLLPLALIVLFLDFLGCRNLPHLILLLWITTNIALTLLADYGQRRARCLAGGELPELLRLAYSNPRPRPDDIIDTISSGRFHIPAAIPTVDPSASFVLNSLNRIPYAYMVTQTIHDFRYLRYSWIAASVHDNAAFVSALNLGDLILYRHDRAVLSNCVCLVTRCYWSHCGAYMGEGQVGHTDLSGTHLQRIDDWLSNPHVHIAVLRRSWTDAPVTKEELAERWAVANRWRYSYIKTFSTLWRIMTGKTGTGLLDRRVKYGLLGIHACLYALLAWLPYVRVVVVAMVLVSSYLYSTLTHWNAYAPNLDQLLGESDAES